MELMETTQVEFDILKTLHVIENDNILSDIFMSDINVSFDVLKNQAKQGTLNPETTEKARKIFDEIIVTNHEPLQMYLKYKEDAPQMPNVIQTPNEDTKPKRKLPKHYGKKRILQDIESAATKTELDRAMLALNDLRNIYTKLKNRGISDKVENTKKLSDEDCRTIIAVVRIVQNKVNDIIKHK
jgi:hypothetical protein